LTSVPATVSNIVAIAAGDYGSLALGSDGTVVSWGSPVAPAGLSNETAIADGYNFGMAIKSDSSITAWGDNSLGQTTVPGSLTNAVAITAGDSHGCALRADGTVVSWGKYFITSGYQTATNKTGLQNVVAIASGSDHDLALIGHAPPALRASANNAQVTGNSFSLSVPTQSGRTYRLEFRDLLTGGNWIALPLVAGTGTEMILFDANATAAQRFYRVRGW
jgi:hypothetical protein